MASRAESAMIGYVGIAGTEKDDVFVKCSSGSTWYQSERSGTAGCCGKIVRNPEVWARPGGLRGRFSRLWLARSETIRRDSWQVRSPSRDGQPGTIVIKSSRGIGFLHTS